MNHYFDIETEGAALGDMLSDQECLIYGMFELKDKHFFEHKHRYIFEAVKDIYNEIGAVDFISLKKYLQDNNLLDKVGGEFAVEKLFSHAGILSSFKGKVKRLKDKHLVTAIHSANAKIRKFTEDENNTPDAIMEYARKTMSELEEGGTDYKIYEPNEISDMIQTQLERTEKNLGMSSGFDGLDKWTGGLREGNLIVIAARVSVGKSVVALQIARKFCEKNIPIGFISLEMSPDELWRRNLASASDVNLHLINQNELEHEQRSLLIRINNEFRKLKLHTVDALNLSEQRLRSLSRLLVTKYGIRCIVVDYIQLMHSEEKNESRVIEIGKITRMLKSISKELRVPVIALAQLSRKAVKDNQEEQEPELHHLRESGNIESDADIVVLLQRYKSDPQIESHKARLENFVYPTKFKIAKNRNGGCTSFDMFLEGKYCRFSDRLSWDLYPNLRKYEDCK